MATTSPQPGCRILVLKKKRVSLDLPVDSNRRISRSRAYSILVTGIRRQSIERRCKCSVATGKVRPGNMLPIVEGAIGAQHSSTWKFPLLLFHTATSSSFVSEMHFTPQFSRSPENAFISSSDWLLRNATSHDFTGVPAARLISCNPSSLRFGKALRNTYLDAQWPLYSSKSPQFQQETLTTRSEGTPRHVTSVSTSILVPLTVRFRAKGFACTR